MLFRSGTIRRIQLASPPVIFTAFGPSSGTINVASSAFTVILYHTKFSGSQTITITDGGNGGTITPSVGSPGTSTVTVTPAANATSFTFTYTPAATGTINLTFTNAQGWVNQAPLSYMISGSSSNSLSISGPSSGMTAYVSSPFTVTLATGTFNGSQTVTISDGGNFGVLGTFAGIGNPAGIGGNSTLTVVPTAGTSSFIFTYQAPFNNATGWTLTITNGQGWTNPAAKTYTSSGITTSNSFTPLLPINPFSPSSWMYQNISAAPVNTANTGLVQNFTNQISAFDGYVGLDPYAGSSMINMAAAGATLFPVTDNRDSTVTNAPLEANVTVPTPPGGDNINYMIQPSSTTYWEFWEFTNAAPPYVSGNSTSAGHATITNYPTSLGDPGWESTGLGVSATNIPLLPTTPTITELNGIGAINHVIGVVLAQAEVGSHFSWPATASDGGGTSVAGTPIPEGIRFRLDPTLNISSYPGLTPLGQAFFIAGQKYGFVAHDTGGLVEIGLNSAYSYSNMGLFSGTRASTGDPINAWIGTANSQGNYAAYTLGSGFPWGNVQFLPYNYGAGYTMLSLRPGSGNINSGSSSQTGQAGYAFAGMTVVVLIYCYGVNATVSNCVDQSGNNFVKAVSTSNAAEIGGEIWYCKLTNDGSGVFTVTTTSPGGPVPFFIVGSGVINTNAATLNGALDVIQTTSGTGTSASLSSGTLGQAQEMIVCGILFSNDTTSYVEPAGWTSIAAGPSLYSTDMAFQYVNGTGGSVTWTPSWANSLSYTALMATFKY